MNDGDLGNLAFEAAQVKRYALLATVHGPLDAWLRQTPSHDGVWQQTQFVTDPSDARATWLVTCDEPPRELTTRVPRERRILFVGEPPAIKKYPLGYLKQFGVLVSPLAHPGYRGIQVRQHGALPWHYGKTRAIPWSAIAASKPKTRLLSVFCSSKTATPQQRARLAFVDRLEKRFGADLDRFGRGVRLLDEKADGIDSYRYHVVLENNLEDGFWTEKLGDAYLGDSFPIYAGGSVPAHDFEPGSRLDIDIATPEVALVSIERAIAADTFERSRDLLARQRQRIMMRHNFFAVADRIMAAPQPPAPRLLTPEPLLDTRAFTMFGRVQRVWRRLRTIVRR